LAALTPSSTELQKLVAFESAFDRIFTIIEAEGSLTHGSTTVQDCLSLLANLLKLNVSNQSYFRETGCVSKLARLLVEVTKEEESPDGVSEWARPQRDLNVWGLLGLVQLFVVRGGQGTPLNQASFWQSGIVVQILHLAFRSELDVSIRAKCFTTCADLVRGNASLQEQFGDLAVPKASVRAKNITNGHSAPNGIELTNVIEALLNIALQPASISLFDVRLAACECVKAFFFGHAGIRIHVLSRAIEGYRSGDDEVPNILVVLIRPSDLPAVSDPYQTWMASVLLFHLLFENPEAKELALAVTDGDAASGEEVITCVQSIATNLITSVQRREDERAVIGCLMLLCGWLFEDPDAVNDFLGEGSSVPSLIHASKMTSSTAPLVAGLCIVLLGIIYEFSSKDSPLPRSKLHGLLVNGLGREIYIDKLTKLRENIHVRDFEVLPQSSIHTDGGLPNVYFDQTFIDFLKDNFSRLQRAIDRDPGFEVSVMANGVQKGISRELVDSLRAQLADKVKTNEDLEARVVDLQHKLDQEGLDHRRTRESASVEVGRIKQINEGLQRNHEEELRRLEEQHRKRQNELSQQDREALEASDKRAAGARQRYEAEISDLKIRISELEAQISKAEKDHILDLQTAHEEYTTKVSALESRVFRAEEKAHEADDRLERLNAELERERSLGLRKKIEEAESARKDVQTELDDLLIVFADLEAKRVQDKKRLKVLGEDVSEGESDREDDEGSVGQDEDVNEDKAKNEELD
jgi:intracellular protein transport protein USO1